MLAILATCVPLHATIHPCSKDYRVVAKTVFSSSILSEISPNDVTLRQKRKSPSPQEEDGNLQNEAWLQIQKLVVISRVGNPVLRLC